MDIMLELEILYSLEDPGAYWIIYDLCLQNNWAIPIDRSLPGWVATGNAHFQYETTSSVGNSTVSRCGLYRSYMNLYPCSF